MAGRCSGRARLLAPDGSTVFREDGSAIRTHGLGPTLNVWLGCLAQCCDDIARRLCRNPHSPRGDLLLSARQTLSHEFPQRKLSLTTFSYKYLALRLR